MPETRKEFSIMSTRRSITDRVSAKREQIEQMKNDLKRLEQEEKNAERKARTKRLCGRAGFLESILPETIGLTDENFKTFVKNHIANGYGKSAIKKLMANQSKEDDTENAAESAPSVKAASAHPPKPQPSQYTEPDGGERDAS